MGVAPLVRAGDANFEKQVRPILAKFCFECHGQKDPKAETNLAVFRSEADVMQDRRQWKQVWEVLRNREMPPEDQPQPTDAERELLTEQIFAVLRRPDPSGRRDPGHVAARRLNSVEYNNTLFDLFSVWKG